MEKKGSYMPNGYIRKFDPVENKSNGFYAEVRGYTRSCGAKHEN